MKMSFTNIAENFIFFYKQPFLIIKGKLGVVKFDMKKSKNFLKILKCALQDVGRGHLCRLNFNGLGFKVEKITSDSFFFKVGFSHTLKICVPKGIKIYSFKNNSVIIVGIDKQKLKEFAIRIKKKKRPNVYKNKGIFFEDEIFYLKEGKNK